MGKVKVGIVGLGRWARVLTRASTLSEKIDIVVGFSRSVDTRDNFSKETGIPTVSNLQDLLSRDDIEGVILTVPNEQHYPVALEVAKAGKHVYTEKPIAHNLEHGLAIEKLQSEFGITVTVGHSARLLGGVQEIKKRIGSGELGRVGFFEANFSNERALELTPDTWRWYKDRAPGGPLSQLAIHMFDVVNYLGENIVEASSISSKLSPVGAEVDDQSMTLLKFSDGAIAYVGTCWTSPGIFALRVFGSKGLIHYEIDFGTWDTPEEIKNSSTFYIQRGKDGLFNIAKGIGYAMNPLAFFAKKAYNMYQDNVQRGIDERTERMRLETIAAQEAEEREAATRALAAANQAAGTGGYQSDFAQDSDFMSGRGTAAEMGSFAKGGLATMFVRKR